MTLGSWGSLSLHPLGQWPSCDNKTRSANKKQKCKVNEICAQINQSHNANIIIQIIKTRKQSSSTSNHPKIQPRKQVFSVRFFHGIIFPNQKQTNLHTHEPLIGSECGVLMNETEEQPWPNLKIKWWKWSNQSYKVRANDQWKILSKKITCLSEGNEYFYLVRNNSGKDSDDWAQLRWGLGRVT